LARRWADEELGTAIAPPSVRDEPLGDPTVEVSIQLVNTRGRDLHFAGDFYLV
jgi:hypothetical protein